MKETVISNIYLQEESLERRSARVQTIVITACLETVVDQHLVVRNSSDWTLGIMVIRDWLLGN